MGDHQTIHDKHMTEFMKRKKELGEYADNMFMSQYIEYQSDLITPYIKHKVCAEGQAKSKKNPDEYNRSFDVIMSQQALLAKAIVSAKEATKDAYALEGRSTFQDLKSKAENKRSSTPRVQVKRVDGKL